MIYLSSIQLNLIQAAVKAWLNMNSDWLLIRKDSPDSAIGAWIIQKLFPSTQVIQLESIETIPLTQLTGQIYFIELAPEVTQVETLLAQPEVKAIVVLANQVSDELQSWQQDYRNQLAQETPKSNKPTLNLVHHSELSCGQLTWDYFHFNEPRPWFVNYVADAVLGRFQYPDSRAIYIGLQVTKRLTWIEVTANSDTTELTGVARLANETETIELNILKRIYANLGLNQLESNASKSI